MPAKHSIKKIALLHFLPLEMYPPVMNLVNFWASTHNNDKAVQLDVYSTQCGIFELAQYKSPAGNITIHRPGLAQQANGLIMRVLHYLLYYIKTIWMLAVSRPNTVLYYDSISSFPAWCYKTFFNWSARIFIHHHEYMSKEEYARGMTLLKWFHKLEMSLYEKADWVSHTNKERMHLFVKDMTGVEIPNQHVLPNFPPASWLVSAGKQRNKPVKIIYIGALSMDTMYTRVFAGWVLKQQGDVIWDIYTLNITPEATGYIQSLPQSIIRLHKGVNYDDLPAVLSQYDAGVILYNEHIPNYIYNAPNKLFEYAAAGLDVWFPDHMMSSLQYVTNKTYPKIIALDFKGLDNIRVDDLAGSNGYTYQPHPFTCEAVLAPLLEKLAG